MMRIVNKALAILLSMLLVTSMLSVGFNVSAMDAPEVVSVTLQPITMKEGVDGWWASAPESDTSEHVTQYYVYTWTNKMEYTVMFSDGGMYVGCDTGFVYNDYWYSVETRDDQTYTTPWLSGNTYTAYVCINNVEASADVFIEPSPIQSVELVPISIIEGTSGYWTTGYNAETGEWDREYYHYNWAESMTYTVTFTDGSQISGHGQEFEYGGQYYNFEMMDAQYTHPWTTGNSYTISVMLMGKSFPVTVTIAPSPVEHIVVNEQVITEYTRGYWEDAYDPETDDYNARFYRYWWTSGLVCTIYFTDGSSVVAQDGGFEYNGQWYGLEYTDNQSYDNPWAAGNTYTQTVTAMGKSAQVNVTIAPSPIQSIEFDPISITEYTNGYWATDYNPETGDWDLEYYHYWWSEKMSFTVTMNDGTVIREQGGGFWYNDEWISINYEDTQNFYDSWTVDNHYTVTASVMGKSASISITIVPSPVQSITVDPISIMEGVGGYWDTEYNEQTGNHDLEYYRYGWVGRVHCTVTMNDGMVITCDTNGFEYNGEWYYVSTSDDQSYRNAWTVNNTYEGKVTVMGQTVMAQISIVPSPVASITVESIAISENSNGYYEYDYNDMGEYVPLYYRYTWSDLLQYTVVTTTGEIIKGSGSHFVYDGEYYFIDYRDDQGYDNRWMVGNTYQGEISVLGKSASVYISICAVEHADGYSYVVQNGTAVITGCDKIVKKLVIPETINGYTVVGVTDISDVLPYVTELVIPDSVTMISDGLLASWERYPLTTVTFGKGIVKLDMSMFYMLQDLTAIHVSADNPTYCSIDGVVYDKAMNKLVACPPAKAQTVVIPETVTNLDVLFDNSMSFTNLSVVIPADNNRYKQVDGVIYNHDMTVVYMCNANKTGSYVMPDSVTRIMDGAFMNSSLSKVVISQNVTDIVYYGFYGSSKLKSVTLPDTLESISYGAFDECSGLIDINLPEGLQYIDYQAFYGTGLKSIAIPGSVEYIGSSAFDSSKLESVTFGEGVREIGSEAFENTPLKSVVLPDSLYAIGSRTFLNCTSLASLTIGAGLEYIPTSAFANTALTTLTLPANVIQLGEDCFRHTKLTQVVFENEEVYIGQGAFDGCPLETLNLGNQTRHIGDQAFRGNKLESLDLPDSVTDIGYRAFSDSLNLSEVDMSDSIESLDGYAFDNTPWYEAQPNGVVYLENTLYTYKGAMPADTDIVVADGTTVIANYAFESQGGLRSITIPASVKSIGWYAFYDCLNLEAIYVDDDNPYFYTENGVLYNQNGYEIWRRYTDSPIVSMKLVYVGRTELSYGEEFPYLWKNYVEVVYENGDQDQVTLNEHKMLSGYDPYKAGKQTVTVTYGAFTDTIEVTVSPSPLTNFYITSMPATTVYELNQSLDLSGLTAMAYYSDGTSEQVTDYMVSGYDPTVGGTQTVTVEYQGFTDDFTVVVDDTLIRFSHTEEAIDISVPVGVIDEDAILVVEPVEQETVTELAPELFAGKSMAAFDIFFEKNEEEVQPNGAVTVSIPVEDTMDIETCQVFHVGDDQVVTPVEATYMNGCMVFDATSFSYYILVADEVTTLCGDVDLDGEADLYDLLVLFGYVNGTEELATLEELAADVNGDGKVTFSDVSRMFYFLNGRIGSL